jgi:hypothetical protein
MVRNSTATAPTERPARSAGVGRGRPLMRRVPSRFPAPQGSSCGVTGVGSSPSALFGPTRPAAACPARVCRYGRPAPTAIAWHDDRAPNSLAAVIEEDHLALNDFMRGNPEPKKRIYSRGDDATLANRWVRPLGVGRPCRDDSMKRPPPCGTPRHSRSNGSARSSPQTSQTQWKSRTTRANSSPVLMSATTSTFACRRSSEENHWLAHRPPTRRRVHGGATG